MHESKRRPGEGAAAGYRDRLPGRSEDSPSARTNQAETIITDIAKNEREFIRIAVKSYQGHRFIDARLHYVNGSESGPTKKGITVGSTKIDKLIEALQRAKAVLGGSDA